MKIRSSWRRGAALLAAGALVLTACGGDEEPDDGGEEASSEATSEDATPSEEMTDDESEDADAGGGGEVLTAEGVTEEPCPDAVNPDNGCIYLGAISDLTQGPFSGAGPLIVDSQLAFWQRVNENGGIGGAYDVAIPSELIRDNLYNPETQNQVYQEIKPDILALAQSLGSPTTQAIVDDLEASAIATVPASWTSANEFQDIILESGNSYCVEASNALDFHAEQEGPAETVLAVHLPGDYGWDGAAGAKKWADANGATFANVQVTDSVDAAVNEIVNTNPDVVVLTLGPTDTGAVVGQAAGRGYTGRFIGNSPTWSPALLGSPAAEALIGQYWQAAPWAPIDSDTPGHQALRDQLESMADELEQYDPDAAFVSDFFTAGWVWSYPLEAALQAAYESGDLTRQGVYTAVQNLETVDYEGMLPEAAGNFGGTVREQAFGETVMATPNPESFSGVELVQDFFEGPTQGSFPFDEPCYVEEGFAS